MNNYRKQNILSFYINIISITEFINQIKKFLPLKNRQAPPWEWGGQTGRF